jgi:hypothetical protein
MARRPFSRAFRSCNSSWANVRTEFRVGGYEATQHWAALGCGVHSSDLSVFGVFGTGRRALGDKSVQEA